MINAYKLSHLLIVGLIVAILAFYCSVQAQTSSAVSSTSLAILNSAPPDDLSENHPIVETGLPKAKKVSETSSSKSSKKTQMFAPVPTSKKASVAQELKASEPLFLAPTRHQSKSTYPWKTNIITTTFWIGEGASAFSSTTQQSSAFIEDWPTANGGDDNPNSRVGYLPKHHAALCNPFYVALPFADLAFPDKARQWVPGSWHRSNKDGKQVSACMGRWVEIRRPGKPSCYAQWEDVGPFETDHAEYVFGEERPSTGNRAGLDISPAVATYLGIDPNTTSVTSWHFVDDDDVPPGAWLTYEEEATLFTALKAMQERPSALPNNLNVTPQSSTPEDEKKKISISKG